MIAFVDLVPVVTEVVSLIWLNIMWSWWKSTLRARSIIRPGEILESVAQSLFMMSEHVIAKVHLYFSFLLRIMLVKSVLLQISFYT